MDERTFATLELPSLVALVEQRVQSPLGRRRAAALLPSIDPREIERNLDLTTECAAYVQAEGGFGLAGLADPELALARLGIAGTSLEPQQIAHLERLVSTGQQTRTGLAAAAVARSYPTLAELAATIPDLRGLLAAIQGKILPGGEIDDRASPELARIRGELVARRARMHRTLLGMVEEQFRAMQEEIVTVRNGRFVIPVRTDSRSQVPGVVHGLSSSGQTTYVEPLPIIESNNELVRLREEEELEIARILSELTGALSERLHEIRATAAVLGELDLVAAKARLSADFHCVRPRMSAASRRILLGEARHVLLEEALRPSGAAVVPISFEMDDAHQTMIISGPNAGGKTVALKTVGLASLMAQMGLHVAAREADLPVFRQVLADIGDQQSISANLSTFTAHIRNVAEMAERVAPPALLLVDEVGTGTDPDEGAALAVAIVDWFRRAGATTIVTTHYNPLKAWAAQNPDVVNASVEFDEATLRPTYRLRAGIAGASAGLEIARRMKLPEEILDEARGRIDRIHAEADEYLKKLKASAEEQESQRRALEEERQATAEKYARLESEFARREAARRAEFEAELERVIRELTTESERLLEELKDSTEAARARKAVLRLRRAAESRIPGGPAREPAGQPRPLPPRNVAPGDRVRIRSLGKEGTVESVSGETITVAIGALRFRSRRDDLDAAQTSAAKPPPSRPASPAPELDEALETEVNVIGMRADEAQSRVDKFLDEAYLGGAEIVRVVHGHGKGILRRVIAELLTGHPHVASFSAADPEHGGAACTVVRLRAD